MDKWGTIVEEEATLEAIREQMAEFYGAMIEAPYRIYQLIETIESKPG